MTAIAIIKRIREVGGDLSFAGDRLKLSVPRRYTDTLVVEARANKDAICRELKDETGGSWDGDDYLALYEERIGIIENDGGKSRTDAETIAYRHCVVEWLDRHPELSEPGVCHLCGGLDMPKNAIVPHGTEDVGYTWLHQEQCSDIWRRRRIDEAECSLSALGITKPTAPAFPDPMFGDEEEPAHD